MLTDNNKTDMIPPFKSLGFVRVSSAHQGCIFFIKCSKTVILWNIITTI